MTKRTISEAENSKRFSTPRKVVLFLEKARWGGRPECPHCKAPKPKKRGGKRIGQYICKACGKEFNVRTGTIFQGTRLCLTIWMKAIYHLLNERSGVSSTELSVLLGITQLSSWFLLHRLRHACCGCDELLEGVVEADETYLGGLEKKKQKSYLRAMAKLGAGPYNTGEVARSAGKTSQHFGPVREALIEKGVIYSLRHGMAEFTAPLFDEFIRRATE